jgi:hypothetical protein
VTSGTVGGSSPGPYTTGVGFRRVWSGTDGKITTFAGTQRDKWNNFTCVVESWLRVDMGWVLALTDTYQSDQSTAKSVQTYTPGFAFDTPTTWLANDQLKLLEKLVKKVKSHDFNLGVNLGQMRQTVDLISGNLQKLGKAALALKRGQFATAARQLGAKPRGTRLKTTDISGRWLELQYGWLPLLGDSFEAAKAFEAISNGPRTQIYRSSHKKASRGNGSQGKVDFDHPYTEVLTKYIQYECVEEMGFARQLGLLDPLSVAWELMPWSFVIDWFIPVGSYLDLVNTVPTLQGRFLSTEVLKQRSTSDYALRDHFFTSGMPVYKRSVRQYISIPNFRHKKTTVSRIYSTSLSVPFPSMHLGGAVHGRRMWNAISLAQQRFARVIDSELDAVSLARIVRTRYRSRRGRPGI